MSNRAKWPCGLDVRKTLAQHSTSSLCRRAKRLLLSSRPNAGAQASHALSTPESQLDALELHPTCEQTRERRQSNHHRHLS